MRNSLERLEKDRDKVLLQRLIGEKTDLKDLREICKEMQKKWIFLRDRRNR